MAFTLPLYHEPDFTQSRLANAPDAVLVPAPRDGIAPANYHSTSMYPEYFKLGGRWLLAGESRMDCTAVFQEGEVRIVEFRNLKRGDLVVTGRSEDGSRGHLSVDRRLCGGGRRRMRSLFARGARGRPAIPATITSWWSCCATKGNTATSFG